MNKPYNFTGLFFMIGGSLAVFAALGWLAGTVRFLDFLCALFVAYLTLCVTNTMQRESSKPNKRH